MASIKKLNNRKYKITVSNGYRPDGRKICRSKTIQVPKSVAPRGIQQYVAHEAEELERTFRDGYSEQAETPFGEYARRWMARQHHLKPSTVANYRLMLEACCEVIGKIPLCKLRPLTIENLVEQLRQRTTRTGKPLCENTVRKYLSAVSAVLSDAKRNELIAHNPARMVSLPPLERPRQAIPTMEEMRSFLTAAMEEPLVYRVYFFMDLMTAARRGELCALTWADITEHTITISKSRSYVKGMGLVTGTTKNGRARVLSNCELLVSLLNGLRMSYEWNGITVTTQTPVFLNRQGKPLNPDTFSRRIRKVYDRCGLSEQYHLHTLRHFAATLWLQSSISKQVVADALGHGDTAFLERTYCHPQLESKQQAAQKSMQLVQSNTNFINRAKGVEQCLSIW